MRIAYFASMLLTGLFGCASIQELPVSELKVNNPRFSFTTKSYVGSEEEAIEKMMDAAVFADQEDAWIEYTVEGKTYFIDVGRYAGVNKIRYTDSSTGEVVFEIDQKSIQHDWPMVWDILSSLPAGTEVRPYHIHPFEEKFLEKPDRHDLKFLLDQRTLPSANDYTAQLQADVLARKECPQVKILPARVVGARGYSEFYTTEQELGIPEISPDDEKTLADIQFDIGFRHITQASFLSPEDTLENAREGLNKQGLRVTYTILRDVPEKIKDAASRVGEEK